MKIFQEYQLLCNCRGQTLNAVLCAIKYQTSITANVDNVKYLYFLFLPLSSKVFKPSVNVFSFSTSTWLKVWSPNHITHFYIKYNWFALKLMKCLCIFVRFFREIPKSSLKKLPIWVVTSRPSHMRSEYSQVYTPKYGIYWLSIQWCKRCKIYLF